jgi:hypothetical protein
VTTPELAGRILAGYEGNGRAFVCRASDGARELDG